MSFDPLPVP